MREKALMCILSSWVEYQELDSFLQWSVGLNCVSCHLCWTELVFLHTKKQWHGSVCGRTAASEMCRLEGVDNVQRLVLVFPPCFLAACKVLRWFLKTLTLLKVADRQKPKTGWARVSTDSASPLFMEAVCWLLHVFRQKNDPEQNAHPG